MNHGSHTPSPTMMNHGSHTPSPTMMNHGGHTPSPTMDHSGHGHHTPAPSMDHSGHGMDPNSMGTGMDHGMMMGHRLFFFSGTANTILFEDWKTSTDGEYAASLLAIFVAAVFTMYLKSVRTGIQRISAPAVAEGQQQTKSAA